MGSRKYYDYEVCYLAFHGDNGKAILLDDRGLSLRSLGSLLNKHRAGRRAIIHLASCYGLKVSQATMDNFLATTGALAVCGYDVEVDTIEAAAFELLLFNHLSGRWRSIGRRLEQCRDAYPDMWARLGFVYSC
ncbi:MAG TPA: hypothetical protein VGG41_12955 [Solirubrobacteraceae bacterium]|jgi:hypothetical protein